MQSNFYPLELVVNPFNLVCEAPEQHYSRFLVPVLTLSLVILVASALRTNKQRV